MNADDLTSRIRIETPETQITAAGVPSKTWKPLCTTWCNWKSLVGDDDTSGQQVTALSRATVTIRKRPGVTAACRVYRSGDPRPYDIVGPVVDPDGGRRWLQMKVQRKEETV